MTSNNHISRKCDAQTNEKLPSKSYCAITKEILNPETKFRVKDMLDKALQMRHNRLKIEKTANVIDLDDTEDFKEAPRFKTRLRLKNRSSPSLSPVTNVQDIIVIDSENKLHGLVDVKESNNKLCQSSKGKKDCEDFTHLKNVEATSHKDQCHVEKGAGDIGDAALTESAANRLIDSCRLCPVCGQKFDLEAFRTHSIECLKQTFSKLDKRCDTADRTIEQVQCQVCSKNITHMTSQRRQLHVNQCLETEDVIKQEEADYQQQLEAARASVLSCPMCGKKFKVQSSRQSHLKKCALNNKMTVEQVKNLVRQQEEEHQAKLNAGILPEDFIPTKLKQGRQNLPSKLKSQFDEDTQLALALSTSLAEDQEKEVLAFNGLFGKVGFEEPAVPGKKGHGKSKKNKPPETSSLLVTLTKEEAAARISDRVTRYTFPQNHDVSSPATPPFKTAPSRESTSGLPAEFGSGKLCARQLQQDWWSKASQTTSSSDPSLSEIYSGVCGDLSFYVRELMPPVVVSSVAAGSKVRRVSCIPGRRRSGEMEQEQKSASMGSGEMEQLQQKNGSMGSGEMKQQQQKNGSMGSGEMKQQQQKNGSMGSGEMKQQQQSGSMGSGEMEEHSEIGNKHHLLTVLSLQKAVSQDSIPPPLSQTVEVLTRLAIESDRGDLCNNQSGLQSGDTDGCDGEDDKDEYLREASGFCRESPIKVESDSTDITSAYLSLVNCPSFSDLVIMTGQGAEIHAHKIVLHARCPGLLSLTSRVNDRDLVDLSSYRKESVVYFLEYLYSGQTSIARSCQAEVRHLAQRFSVARLAAAVTSCDLGSSFVEDGQDTNVAGINMTDADTCRGVERTERNTFDDDDWLDVFQTQREKMRFKSSEMSDSTCEQVVQDDSDLGLDVNNDERSEERERDSNIFQTQQDNLELINGGNRKSQNDKEMEQSKDRTDNVDEEANNNKLLDMANENQCQMSSGETLSVFGGNVSCMDINCDNIDSADEIFNADATLFCGTKLSSGGDDEDSHVKIENCDKDTDVFVYENPSEIKIENDDVDEKCYTVNRRLCRVKYNKESYKDLHVKKEIDENNSDVFVDAAMEIQTNDNSELYAAQDDQESCGEKENKEKDTESLDCVHVTPMEVKTDDDCHDRVCTVDSQLCRKTNSNAVDKASPVKKENEETDTSVFVCEEKVELLSQDLALATTIVSKAEITEILDEDISITSENKNDLVTLMLPHELCKTEVLTLDVSSVESDDGNTTPALVTKEMETSYVWNEMQQNNNISESCLESSGLSISESLLTNEMNVQPDGVSHLETSHLSGVDPVTDELKNSSPQKNKSFTGGCKTRKRKKTKVTVKEFKNIVHKVISGCSDAGQTSQSFTIDQPLAGLTDEDIHKIGIKIEQGLTDVIDPSDRVYIPSVLEDTGESTNEVIITHADIKVKRRRQGKALVAKAQVVSPLIAEHSQSVESSILISQSSLPSDNVSVNLGASLPLADYRQQPCQRRKITPQISKVTSVPVAAKKPAEKKYSRAVRSTSREKVKYSKSLSPASCDEAVLVMQVTSPRKCNPLSVSHIGRSYAPELLKKCTEGETQSPIGQLLNNSTCSPYPAELVCHQDFSTPASLSENNSSQQQARPCQTSADFSINVYDFDLRNSQSKDSTHNSSLRPQLVSSSVKCLNSDYFSGEELFSDSSEDTGHLETEATLKSLSDCSWMELSQHLSHSPAGESINASVMREAKSVSRMINLEEPPTCSVLKPAHSIEVSAPVPRSWGGVTVAGVINHASTVESIIQDTSEKVNESNVVKHTDRTMTSGRSGLPPNNSDRNLTSSTTTHHSNNPDRNLTSSTTTCHSNNSDRNLTSSTTTHHSNNSDRNLTSSTTTRHSNNPDRNLTYSTTTCHSNNSDRNLTSSTTTRHSNNPDRNVTSSTTTCHSNNPDRNLTSSTITCHSNNSDRNVTSSTTTYQSSNHASTTTESTRSDSSDLDSSPLPLRQRLGLTNPFESIAVKQTVKQFMSLNKRNGPLTCSNSQTTVPKDNMTNQNGHRQIPLSKTGQEFDQDLLCDQEMDVETIPDDVSEKTDNMKTPKQSKSRRLKNVKKTGKIPSPFTPMAPYDDMLTPDLKKAVSKIGVRPLGKKRMRDLLKRVYQETHQYETDSDYDGTPVKHKRSNSQPVGLSSRAMLSHLPLGAMRGPGVRNKSKLAKNAKSNKMSQTGSKDTEVDKRMLVDSSQQRSRVQSQMQEVHGRGILGSDVLSEDAYNEHENISGSQESSFSDGPDLPEESILQGWPEDEAVPSHQVQSNQQAVTDKLVQFVRSNPDVYESILMYEPLELDVLKKRIMESGIKVSMSQLMDFLDDRFITFTMKNMSSRNNNRQRRCHKSGKSPSKRKNLSQR